MARRLPPGVPDALVAATVFGASTPFAKRLGDGVNPLVMAGLLYLGSGLGLSASLLIRRSGGRESSIQRSDGKALLGVVVFGGVLAPILLLVGLRTTPAASASLLLNLEAVFTALGAWLFVREHADRRIVVGMLVIVAGGVLLSFQPDGRLGLTVGALAITGACACWGVDNVMTRPLSVRDPRQIAATKGVLAGVANLSMGLLIGGHLPSAGAILGALILGLVGYGVSLVLYVRAVRQLGTARTGAYYAAAPFVGAAIGLVWLREPVGRLFLPALVLMAIGLGIHLTERHLHGHRHDPVLHAHGHEHVDAHHLHGGVDNVAAGAGQHLLEHSHEPLEHSHPHTPDTHHRHDH